MRLRSELNKDVKSCRYQWERLPHLNTIKLSKFSGGEIEAEDFLQEKVDKK